MDLTQTTVELAMEQEEVDSDFLFYRNRLF